MTAQTRNEVVKSLRRGFDHTNTRTNTRTNEMTTQGTNEMTTQGANEMTTQGTNEMTTQGTKERMGGKPQAQENKSKLIKAKKTLERRDKVLTAAIRRCHVELAKKESLRDIDASKNQVEAAWKDFNHANARYCARAGWGPPFEEEKQPEDARRALLEWKVLTDMMEQVVDKAEEYLESATKENSRDELYEDEDGGNVLDAEVEVRLWVEQLSAMNKVNEMALEVSAMNKVNEVALEVSTVDNVNEVSVSEVNVNDVNKVNQEPTMNEDSGEVCDAKEEMRKGKPPEVLQRFDFDAKVHAEDDKEVGRLPPLKEVKEESCHANWDPGELIDAEDQMKMLDVEEVAILVKDDNKAEMLVNDVKARLRLSKKEARLRGDENANALFNAMLLFNFMRLYISEVLVPVARNVARFVNRFRPDCPVELSDYG